MYSNGHKYWLAYTNDKIGFYRCYRHITSKCPGRCVSENGVIRVTEEHNHPAEPDRLLVDKFRKVLTHRAALEKTDLFAIYCEEATQRHSDAAMLYPFKSAESAMRKARRKRLLQPPNSVDDIGGVLDQSELFRVNSGSNKDPIYQKTITLDDATCMIFMHKKTFELFGKIDEIHIDCSIHFNCQEPPNYFLMTIHAAQSGITAPIVYALLTSKTQSIYAALFAYLREDLKIFPNIIMSNFDHLMQSSLSYTFPEAIIKGCWFHYTDSIIYQVKYLDMQRETSKGMGASALRMLLVLPLLPPEYMTPGLEAVKRWMKEKNIFTKSLSNLCEYIEQAWIRGFGAAKISIFGAPSFSTHVQNLNKDLLNAINVQNPVLWTILECITQLATKTYIKTNKRMKTVQNLKNSPSSMTSEKNSSLSKLGRPQKKSEMLVDTIISNATQLWIKTPVHLRNPLQFLQLSSHCVEESMLLPIIDSSKSKGNDSVAYREWQSQQYSSFLQKTRNYQSKYQHSSQNRYSDFNSSNLVSNVGKSSKDKNISTQRSSTETSASNKSCACTLNNLTSASQGKAPILSGPPPLAFFPVVKQLAMKRKLPPAEPPPLVQIKYNK